jgi:hypothetical protein
VLYDGRWLRVNRRSSRFDEGSSALFEPARLFALLVVGIVAFAVWIGVLIAVPPERLLSYLAFFVPLWAFVACGLAAGLYWFTTRVQSPHPRALSNSVREGSLVSGVLTVNLAFSAGHRLTLLVFLITIALALSVELWGRLRPERL